MPQDTRDRILDAAQRFAQQRGFNAFSYADIAQEVGVRKASVHHHFASKGDLELALVERYRSRFRDVLSEIEVRHAGAMSRLRAYAALYRATLAAGGICLGGMMASDIDALPETLRVPLGSFFSEQAQWIARVLSDGRRTQELVFNGPPLRRARVLLALLQGGLIVAHATRNTNMYDAITEDVFASLVPR